MEQLHSFLVAELGSERTDWLPGSKPLIVQLLKYKDLLCAGAELSLVWADGPGNRWLQGCLWDVSWAEGSLEWARSTQEGFLEEAASKLRPEGG